MKLAELRHSNAYISLLLVSDEALWILILFSKSYLCKAMLSAITMAVLKYEGRKIQQGKGKKSGCVFDSTALRKCTMNCSLSSDILNLQDMIAHCRQNLK
ncbi:hypothetical protein CEXT_29141 [Caerostris extrusa]|uniref:Uncharacterized protein n=1 Tax=Caerostris extrusa TaxID=172846 RepID=A0AAV4PGT7_CAEEX|nr:hypothetical protein CEXT_29141 [Caerostris extrusa]